MRLTGFAAALCGSSFAFSMSLAASPAMAKSQHHHQATAHTQHTHSQHGRAGHAARYAGFSVSRPRVIQCVAFAKSDAGIDISGNARDWWSNAAGVYERGARPEPGSVLSFRATGRMPLGHVAVVSAIGDSRTITIDQSHWGRNGISRDIVVKDVSEDNDWSAVRVQLDRREEFGSIYPTHGFIYPRPDRGMVMAVNDRPTDSYEAPASDRVHRRPLQVSDRGAVEVAEAPASGPPASGPIDLSTPGISAEAPSRGLR